MGKLPDQEVLRELLDYDPGTGILTWKKRSVKWFVASKTRTAQHVCNHWNSRYAGTEAFTSVGPWGYREGILLRKPYKAHRLIWKLVYGEDPDQIDHIDGVFANNALHNLRNVSMSTNSKNKSRYANNTTGVPGVHKSRTQRYVASISVDGKRIHLGTFDDIGSAKSVRESAEREFGYHENHGRIAA